MCIIMHVDGAVQPETLEYAFCFMRGPIGPLRQWQMDHRRQAPSNGSGGPSLRALMRLQHGVCEIRDRMQRRRRRFPMRRVSGPLEQGHIDWTIALLLRDLDLPEGPILVVGALDDRDGNADIGEVFRDIPVAEFRIE